jgi:hypothetical protein
MSGPPWLEGEPQPLVLSSIEEIEAYLEETDPGTDAYDGQNLPPKRELTARERDVLCRMLTFVLHSDQFATGHEKARLFLIRDVINPRED